MKYSKKIINNFILPVLINNMLEAEEIFAREPFFLVKKMKITVIHFSKQKIIITGHTGFKEVIEFAFINLGKRFMEFQ